MNYALFSNLFAEVADYNSEDFYIAERGWQEWMEDFPEENLGNILSDIYTLGKKSTKELIEDYKKLFKNSKYASKSCDIPPRTLNHWCIEERQPPLYVLTLIAYAVFTSRAESNE